MINLRNEIDAWLPDKVVHSEEYMGYTIIVRQDGDPIAPDNDDEQAFLVYGHRQFEVDGPDKQKAIDVHRDKEKWEKTHHVYPVYAYIHSGVKLGLTTVGMVDVQWDVSMCGYILITKDVNEIPKPDKYAQGMIDEWNQYLSGDVYEFAIKDAAGTHLESCYGFYGLEHCIQEAHDAVTALKAVD